MQISLTPDQQTVHDAVIGWHHEAKKPSLRIGGWAGTGKTTLTAGMVHTLRKDNPKLRIAFIAFTGKAAYVLREKLTMAGVAQASDYIGTIHGLIYQPVVVGGEVVSWSRVDHIEADLLVIDEASMVGEVIWKDLLSYDIPILAVGDHGQLPPVGGRFNLMENPDHTLTKIHRQAAGNPIIKVSVLAREEGCIPLGVYGNVAGPGRVSKIQSSVGEVVDRIKDIRESLFLCGRNSTRTLLNKQIRRRLLFKSPEPMAKETLICLKNNREKGIFNGMTGTLKKIKSSSEDFYHARIVMDDGTAYNGSIIKLQFGSPVTLKEHPRLDPIALRDLFDWGYALTVWKAQGSEADNVVLFEERFSRMEDSDWKKYLYTGVTRARKNLIIVEPKS